MTHDWGGLKVREMIELIKQKKVSLNALGLVKANSLTNLHSLRNSHFQDHDTEKTVLACRKY